MGAQKDNRFTFKQSDHLPGVTLLRALMRDFSYEKHGHEEVAIGVTLAGRQQFSCKGALFTSMPGNVIVFNPGEVHDGRPGDAAGLRYAMLYIRPDQLYPLIDCASGRKDPAPRLPETMFQDAELRALVLAFSRLIAEKNGSRLDQELQLFAIAQSLARILGRFQPAGTVDRKDACLMRVKEFILANLDRELPLDELCAVAHMSKFHFIRMFRAQFGMTPHRFALNCRVNRARGELEAGRPPSDVAQMFGFADLSHFNRRFKQVYGATPRRYQLQLLR